MIESQLPRSATGQEYKRKPPIDEDMSMFRDTLIIYNFDRSSDNIDRDDSGNATLPKVSSANMTPTVYVVGNTSAALVEGTSVAEPNAERRYDVYDSGSQMVTCAPPDSTVVVQMPSDKMTEENIEMSQAMLALERESLIRLGVRTTGNVFYTENLHDFIAERRMQGERMGIMPLFPSERLFGDQTAALAAQRFNNKEEFLRLVNEVQRSGEYISLPNTYFFDTNRFPGQGYPSVRELVLEAEKQGSELIFFKKNVSAGGYGVETVQASDIDQIHDTLDKWYKNMLEARQKGSNEYDFHIQLGVPKPKLLEGVIESPCIVAAIEPEGANYNIKLLQAAQ